AASIKALAAHENVYVKVGGLGQAVNGLGFEKQAEPPSSEMVANAMRPYVETCIEAFGTRRCMFESNFTPDKEGFSYQVYWNACKLLTRGGSGMERADLFAGTAARFYRLTGIGWRPPLDVPLGFIFAPQAPLDAHARVPTQPPLRPECP